MQAMAVVSLWVVSSVVSQTAGGTGSELSDAMEILRRADAACKTVKIVRYKASAQGLGADEARMPKVEGTAVFGGWVNNAPERFRYDAKVQKPGSSETQEYSAGSDGNLVYLIDPQKKTVYADMDPAVLGSAARPLRSILVGKIVNPEAFKDELKAEKVELKGTTKVGDEECYDVFVSYGQDNGEGVWSISKKDFLPRRVERSFPRPDGGKGGRLVTLTDLVVNPKIEGDPFKLVVPQGFSKTDEFAP